ncbi:MAG: molybdopterin-guanine dinucleotide biosynthesis protein MobB [Synergistes sp.]|nr:molybdopterin-guanine dinucleotide biosynthesis protein MobB [Synergistes sp.]
MIRTIAVSGFKNSGKTTLCHRLVEELTRLGVRTGYIKRTSEEALGTEDADTSKLRSAGVTAVLWGDDGLRAEESGCDISHEYIVSKYFPECEIVILEGGKYLELPKIWVESETPRPEEVKGVFMLYDRTRPGDGASRFGCGDEALMAEKLAAFVRGENYRSSSVFIGSRELSMKDFIADFVRGAVLGMLSSLKGGKTHGEEVKIVIRGEKEEK